MYNFSRFFRGSLSPNLVFDTVEYKRAFRKAHPEYFDPDGILVFCGAQGQGKTLSAVAYLRRLCLAYPAVVVCTNVALVDSDEIVMAVLKIRQMMPVYKPGLLVGKPVRPV